MKVSSAMRVAMALVVLLCAGLVQAQSADVPPYLVHQGRLMDALNAPVNGTQDLTFNLYAEEAGGVSFWTETQTVVVSNGFYSVTLGQGQPLDLAQFNGATLYLGVTVAGEELTPRLALQSVPYAVKSRSAQSATTAENVTGDITPNSITVGGTVIDAAGITVNGTTIVDPSGQWAGPAPVADYDTLLNPPFTFDNLNCLNGDVAQFVGGAWMCTPASSADTLSGLGCAEGQTAKFVAGAWSCADDLDTATTYTAGNGITIGAANDIAADTTVLQARVFGACLAGEAVNTINADGSVVCEPDTDTDTTYTAGAGIMIGAANDIAVDTVAIQGRVSGSCIAGESIRQINADGTVICEPDTDTDTTYSAAAGGGLTLSGTNAFGIAANAIDSSRIADGTVTSADIADGTITSADIADATVTSTDILNATIVSADLAVGAVASTNILDGTVAAADINSAEVQRRVASVCAAGSSIRTVNVDGTVVCEVEPTAPEIAHSASGNLVIQSELASTSTWADAAEPVLVTFPDNRQGYAHRSTESGTGCYNWAVSSQFPIDPNKTYEFSIWIKSSQADLDNYMGFYAYDSVGAQVGGAWGNPYFKTGQGDPNVWVKWTGYLLPSYVTDANADGYADQQVSDTNGSDWRMPPATRSALIRFGACYGDGAGAGITDFAYPSVREVASAAPYGLFIPATFQNGWLDYNTTYNPAGYTIDNSGFVHLRGLVRSGTIGAAIFTLPARFRPAYRVLAAAQTNPDTIGRVDILPDGQVIVVSGNNGWVSLDNIIFKAE